MTAVNQRAVVFQAFIFSLQWALMLAGFWILKQVASVRIFESEFMQGEYFDAMIKALLALSLSVIWLFLWDREVRFLFYRTIPTEPR